MNEDPREFVRVATIVNQVTGADVPVNAEIHRDDIDWLLALHQEAFMLDWKIARATGELFDLGGIQLAAHRANGCYPRSPCRYHQGTRGFEGWTPGGTT